LQGLISLWEQTVFPWRLCWSIPLRIPCDYLAPDVIKPDLWVYPNPNNGHFTVESAEPIPAGTYFVVRGTYGKKMAEWQSTKEEQTVAYPGPPLAPGVYFVGVWIKREKHYYYLKIVVQP
jgi:hypothetical protein